MHNRQYGSTSSSIRVVEVKLVYNKEVESWHCGAAVKRSGNSTNPTVHMAKRHEGMKIKLPTTVLSGAEERGVDGPSLDRSYFSRLDPANLVLIFRFVFESHSQACSAYTVLDIDVAHAHNAFRAGSKRLKCFEPSTWSRFKVSNAAEEVVFTAKCCCME